MFAHELRAQKPVGLRVGHHLHKAAVALHDDSLCIAEQGALAGFRGNAGRFGLGVRDAHHGDLRTAVDTAGHHVLTNMIVQPAQHFHTGGTLGRSHVGKLHFGADVADGVHTGDGGLVTVVHLDGLAVHLRLAAVGKQSLQIGLPADGAQHHFSGGRAGDVFGDKVDGGAVFAFGHVLHHGVQMQPDASLFQDLRQILAQLPVHGGQQAVHALDNGDVAAQVVVEGGELHADHAAPDDDNGPVQVVAALQQLVRGEHAGQVQSGNRGSCGH